MTDGEIVLGYKFQFLQNSKWAGKKSQETNLPSTVWLIYMPSYILLEQMLMVTTDYW